MPTIPFPIVPLVAGVPNVPRSSVNLNIDANVTIPNVQGQFTIAQPINVVRWGFYAHDTGQSIFDLNVVAVTDFTMAAPTIVADFPVEGGRFADFDKIIRPKTPVVTFNCMGSDTDRRNFLNTLETARLAVTTVDIYTQELNYQNYVIQNYSYSRSAGNGVSMISVRVELLEVMTVTAQYTTVSPLSNPQNPYNMPQVSTGTVQTQSVSGSTVNNVLNGGGR